MKSGAGVYCAYRAKDGTEASMFRLEDERTDVQEYLMTHTVNRRRMRLEATFWADGWDEAVEIYETIMWGES